MNEPNAALSTDSNDITVSFPPQSMTLTTGQSQTVSDTLARKSITTNPPSVRLNTTTRIAVSVITVQVKAAAESANGTFYVSTKAAIMRLAQSDYDAICTLANGSDLSITYNDGIDPTVSSNSTSFRYGSTTVDLTIVAKA